jgi:ADP-heptose:LPS heptosyltransferase
MDKSMIDFQAGLRAVTHPEELQTRARILTPQLGRSVEENAWQREEDPVPITSDGNGSPLVPLLYLQPAKNYSGGGEIVSNVNKIAVLRSNGIGDYLFSVPAINALRQAYPQAEIVLLGLKWHERFLGGRPGPIDRVEVVPRVKGVGSSPDIDEDPKELKDFFRQMSKEHFDIAIQMHGGGRYSNPFVQRLGARLTAGACSEDAIPLDRWISYQYYQMEVLRYLEIAGLVGAKPVNLEPDLHLLESDLAESAGLLPYSNIPFAILHPGASDARRRWPVQKFAAVGNSLAWSGARVVVTGNQGEVELAEQVKKAMAAPAINLAGKLSLGGLAGLLSRSSVVVSNDSGPLHLARAVGAPTVGIYWCGNMINAGPVTRARHRTAVSWQLVCPVCGLNCTRSKCEHNESFVNEVPEVEVKTAAMDLMETYGRPRQPVGSGFVF